VCDIDAVTTAIVPAYRLELRQRFTPLQNRYDLIRVDATGAEAPVGYAEQKRFALKERVTFWSGPDKSQVVFTIGARNILELAGTYDVQAPDGTLLATVRKDVAASLLRSTYRVELPGGGELLGQERGPVRSALRRIVGLVSDLPWPLPIQFDFTTPAGQTVFSVERRLSLRDSYSVPVTDPALDWRVPAALAVAVDAFMNR
jgi:uncharacterized protein YxjI